MEDTLKRLLAAEAQANEITTQSLQAAERLIQDALSEARNQEERFKARLPELRASYLDKGEKRATQSILELQRRYEERLSQLRNDADAHEEEALEAAFAYLIRPQGPSAP